MTKQWMPLTDSQWDAISPFFNTKRKRTLNLRTVLDTIFYLLRTGCQWRNLPDDKPDWQAIYYYFDQWKTTGVYQKMNDELNKLDRMNEVRDALPSALCADSQSVDLAPMIFEDRGLDPNKKVNGRKRQWLVDMGGRLWRTTVHSANGADGPSAKILLDNLDEINHRLDLFFGDMAYNGVFADAVVAGGYRYEKAAKPESKQGFVPVKGRWVVEPVRRCGSISWTNFFRRIVKDYEYTTSSSEAFLYLSNSLVMLQRIDKQWST